MQCLLPVSHELPHEHGGGTGCGEAQVKLVKSVQAPRRLKVSKKATDVAQGADRNQVLLQMLDEAPLCVKESSPKSLVHREGSETMPRCLEDPDFLQEMLQQLPKPLYWAVNSDLAVGVLVELA